MVSIYYYLYNLSILSLFYIYFIIILLSNYVRLIARNFALHIVSLLFYTIIYIYIFIYRKQVLHYYLLVLSVASIYDIFFTLTLLLVDVEIKQVYNHLPCTPLIYNRYVIFRIFFLSRIFFPFKYIYIYVIICFLFS